MDEPKTLRIVLLGKTGNGKSSLANTIFGETVFKVNHFNNSDKTVSQSETKCVNGRNLTLIDTPGFFDPGKCEEDMKPEMLRWTMQCAPGPHVFLIVLKVEKFTEQEQSVITRICQHFSDDVLKYAAVVFTHGDQLPDQMKIEQYVSQSQALSELVERCGGRCHIFDNKYWKDNQEDDYRNNHFQVAQLFNTIEAIVTDNAGGYYTNAALQEKEREIQKEEEQIRQSSQSLSQEQVREQAISNILRKQEESGAWKKGLILAAVTGLSVAAAVVWITSKNVPLPGHELLESVLEKAPEVSPVVAVVESVIEAVPVIEVPVSAIEEFAVKTAETVSDRMQHLYERTYDPYNLFI